MCAPAVRRLFVVSAVLVLAGLACATSDVPIDPNATAPVAATVRAAPTETPTVIAAQPTRTAPPPTRTPPSSPTPGGFAALPIPNGDFAASLNGWGVSDTAYVGWQDGYARLNASQAPGGAGLARDLDVPLASTVLLTFRYRSENVADGDCAIEPRPGDVRRFPADHQWRVAEVSFTAEAGDVYQIGVSTHLGGACTWVHVDDFNWLVPAAEAPPTPVATLRAPTATLAAIPGSFVFTQTFTVSAEGDFPAGLPSTLNDGLPSTWASLPSGHGLWQFDLGRAQTVAGFRLLAVRDGDQDTTLIGLDISFDGHNWVNLYTPSGQCGPTPNCLVIAQGEPVELPLGPLEARHLRLRGGPTRFALAEVEIAVLP
jgi:hypothetical protein